MSPRRGQRPVDGSLQAPEPRATGGGHADCPFCPGHDDALGPVVHEIPGPEGWLARSVENLYPFVEGGDGAQEVLVETPRHAEGFHRLTPREATVAMDLYRDRLRAHHRLHPGWEAHLFRNEGRDAGTSRSHPHGQLLTLSGSTPGRSMLESRLREAHAGSGTCLVCREAAEGGAGGRGVLRTSHFAAATLHAPLDPFHLRIFPLRHGPSLAEAHDGEAEELAAVLLALTGALARILPGVAWNLLFHDHGPHPHGALHWHLELRPRASRTAGFEQMAGVGVCPSDPVQDAARLRALLSPTETTDRD